MRAHQTSGHLPVAVAQAFVLTRPTRGADTSAQAICDLILTSRLVWLGGGLAIAVEEGERAALKGDIGTMHALILDQDDTADNERHAEQARNRH
jgi:hypothetical protein